MLALTMAFGLEATMLAVTQDLGKGVIDRFRSMPMCPRRGAGGPQRRGHAPVGSLARRDDGGRLRGRLALAQRAAAALGAVGLLLLLRFAMLWAGIHLAMVAGRPEMVTAVQILVWPVGFLSNVFATPASMPGWLGAVVEWNPMSATATAVRELFGNPGGATGSWAAEHAELLAVLWPAAIIAVFFPLAVRKFARLSR